MISLSKRIIILNNRIMKNIINKFSFKNSVKLIIGLVVISYCIGCNKLKEGSVIEKWYEATETNLIMMPHYMQVGKVRTMYMVPYYVTDNEDFVIKLKGKHNGKDRIETVYLTQAQYDCLQIGDYLRIGDDCSFDDTNNSKRRK